jgi:hypothetical protein
MELFQRARPIILFRLQISLFATMTLLPATLLLCRGFMRSTYGKLRVEQASKLPLTKKTRIIWAPLKIGLKWTRSPL